MEVPDYKENLRFEGTQNKDREGSSVPWRLSLMKAKDGFYSFWETSQKQNVSPVSVGRFYRSKR